MNVCPHCGAKLRENARFCTACMTALIDKRVIPTPKYNLHRWLSGTAAVLVLVLALWGVWTLPSNDAPVTPTVDTFVPATTTSAATADTTTTDTTAEQSTTATEVQTTSSVVSSLDGHSTTLTTLAESFAADPLYTTRTPWIYTTTTTGTTGRVPPFLTTTSTSGGTTITTKPSTTTKATTTKKPTTTTTAAASAYPEEWDTVYRSTTEDDLAIEEVTWTYKAAGDTLSLYYYKLGGSGLTGSISRKYTKTFRYNVPMSECIILTGFDAPTENGIYRIPAAIDGKVVVGVDMRTAVEGACQFNDAAIAPTVKRLYLPPELLMIQTNTINQCTALEGIYFGCHTIWIAPDALPYVSSGLDLLSYTNCYMSCAIESYDLPILKNYCYYMDHGAGATLGSYRYYKHTTWRLSNFAWLELYD